MIASQFNAHAFGEGLWRSALGLLLVLIATFIAGRIAKKHSVIDTAWGLLFSAVAIVTFFASAGHGDAARRWLLLILPVLWGVRLALHIGSRTWGKPEDPRYEKLLSKGSGSKTLYAIRMVYLLQGALAFLIAAPIMVGAYQAQVLRWWAWIGVALWGVGLFFEAVGDAQKERFLRNRANKGKIVDVGLWRYTRHPNYFGDACIWWGIFLVAAASWPVLLTIFAPILMTYLLTAGSGVRILEQHMAGRPGWAEYAAQTSVFIPRPPRRRAG